MKPSNYFNFGTFHLLGTHTRAVSLEPSLSFPFLKGKKRLGSRLTSCAFSVADLEFLVSTSTSTNSKIIEFASCGGNINKINAHAICMQLHDYYYS